MIFKNKIKFNFVLISSMLMSGVLFSQSDSLNYTSKTGSRIPDGIVQVDQDPKIEKLIETRIKMNRSDNNDYYKIQIYNGPLSGAEEAKNEFKKQYRDLACDISFESPNYKVRVGKFRTRLEADKQLLDIRKKYSNAFLLAP